MKSTQNVLIVVLTPQNFVKSAIFKATALKNVNQPTTRTILTTAIRK
jgi:hypothetical protein